MEGVMGVRPANGKVVCHLLRRRLDPPFGSQKLFEKPAPQNKNNHEMESNRASAPCGSANEILLVAAVHQRAHHTLFISSSKTKCKIHCVQVYREKDWTEANPENEWVSHHRPKHLQIKFDWFDAWNTLWKHPEVKSLVSLLKLAFLVVKISIISLNFMFLVNNWVTLVFKFERILVLVHVISTIVTSRPVLEVKLLNKFE